MADGAETRGLRGLYTTLLLVVGVASAFIAGSIWPVVLAAGAAGAGWAASRPRRALPAGPPDDARSELAQLSGDLRRRHLQTVKTAEDVRALLARSGRDASLWEPEGERVEQLVRAHLALAARIEEDEALGDEEDALRAKVKELKTRSPESDVAREIARVEERLELALARKRRSEERRRHLEEIEHGLATVRDRLATLPDGVALRPEIDQLVAGVEAAAAAELETSRLVAGLRSQGAIEGPGTA